MMRRTSLFLLPLFFIIIQGCSTSRYHTATPYHRKPEPRQVIEQRDIQAPPTEQPVIVPENSIAVDISYQASQLIQNGDLEAAAQTLERGLRIAPKDAYLWSQLATVRLQQRRYGQAQSLAAKSSSLAQGNSSLIYRNQVISEKARQQQGY
ncbi:MAG TPA: tetratricopeptide repeat protein [Desulfocapsa sulfexigens]|nr:tetratricopeptide repeat protein [Desulfocapsa sulfexigens]